MAVVGPCVVPGGRHGPRGLCCGAARSSPAAARRSLDNNPPSEAGRRSAIAGAFCAIAIYACVFPSARWSVQNGLGADALVAIRFGVAAILLLPALIHRDLLRLGGLGWRRGSILALMIGAPNSLLMMGGLRFAPANHAALLNPGTVAVSSMLAAWYFLGDRPSRIRLIGTALVIAGLASVSLTGGASGGPDAWIGDLMFIVSAFGWAGFFVLARVWRVEAVPTAAAIALISSFYSLGWLATGGLGRVDASLTHVGLQMLNQGVLNGVLATLLFTRAAIALGPAKIALFPPMVPVLGTILAAVTLGEFPLPIQWAGLALALVGMLLSTGLFSRR